MRFSNKGLELAANTIVLLIVAVVILSIALSLTYRVFCAAEDYTLAVDAQSEERIERLMQGGGDVAISDNTKEAKLGGSVLCSRNTRERVATFTLGIRNPVTTANNFCVAVELGPRPLGTPSSGYGQTTPAQDSEEVQVLGQISTIDSGNVLVPVSVAAGDVESLKILTVLPGYAPVGQYVYNVKVYRGTCSNLGAIYGAQQLYLTAE